MELRTPDLLSLIGNVHENLKRFKKQWSNYSVGYEVDKKDEKVQVAIFLNILGTDAEEILNTLIITEAQKKTLDGLLKVLTEFAKPKLNIAYCRYLFNTRDQQEGESFDQFYMATRKLAEDCGFEKLRDSLIRDRIIIGIHDVQLRERLLGEELPLEKVVSLCLSVEAGKKRSNEVNQPKASSVDLVNSGRFQSNLSNQGNNFTGQGQNNNLGQGYNHQNKYNSPNQQQPSRIIDCRSCGQQHPGNVWVEIILRKCAVRPCGIIATIKRVCARPGNSHTDDETRATCQSRPSCFECVCHDLAIINIF